MCSTTSHIGMPGGVLSDDAFETQFFRRREKPLAVLPDVIKVSDARRTP
jgi:hypothetical protein